MTPARLLTFIVVTTLLMATHHVQPKPGTPLANQLFGAKNSASKQKPKVYGYYAKGCLAGGEQLAETGPTWQAMRLSRNRNWAHPEMIDFVQTLSRQAVKIGWKGLYIGDMAQPRGGPMTSSHASHQNGLDADIWLLPPKSINLTRKQRENISSISVRTADQRNITRAWTRSHMELIKAASKDPRTARIFINAAAKIEMCRTAGSDRAWLGKVRPIQGHNTHFHVRLKCPPGSPKCVTQVPVPKGDGCDKSLQWWVTDYLKPPPPKKPKQLRPKPRPKTKPKPKKKPKNVPPPRRTARTMIMADLPNQCMGVLKSK